MRSRATSVGVPHTAALGCSAAARLSAVTPGATAAVTSLARCSTFGSSSTYGCSGTFSAEQKGPRARGDRRDRVLVLLEVLARARQRVGAGEVGAAVAGPLDRPGQHPRRGQARLEADQHLGRRADQTVDEIGPAARVGVAQPADEPAGVQVGVGHGHQVTRQHDLVEQPGADVAHGPRDRGAPLLRRQRAALEAHPAGRPGHGTRDGRRAVLVGLEPDLGEPRRARPAGRGRSAARPGRRRPRCCRGRRRSCRRRRGRCRGPAGRGPTRRRSARRGRSTTPRRPEDRRPCAAPPRPRRPCRHRRAARRRRRSRAASRPAVRGRAPRRSAPAAAGGPGSARPDCSRVKSSRLLRWHLVTSIPALRDFRRTPRTGR